jgi:hypothetical protein
MAGAREGQCSLASLPHSTAPPGIVQVVWDVVAMAAVHAMAAGRKHMW